MDNFLKRQLSPALVLLLVCLTALAPSCKESESGVETVIDSTPAGVDQETQPEVNPAQTAADQSDQDVQKDLDEAQQKLKEFEAQLEKIQAEQQARQKVEEQTILKTDENLEPPREKLIPLEIDLPRPMFVGTPPNTQIDPARWEKPLGKPRPLLPVPPGTVNISLGKPVTSSDLNPIIGDLEQITDGDKKGIDGNWVELMFGMQWVQIDLEETYEIQAVVIWHFHMQPWIFRDVVVQVSNDPDFISAATLFNNDYDNSSGLGAGADLLYTETNEGKLVEGKSTKARYVRLYSNGNTENDSNQYIEVEVYGKPIQ